jgi:hypothetical protein
MAWTTLGTVAPGDVLRANSGTAAYNNVIGNLDYLKAVTNIQSTTVNTAQSTTAIVPTDISGLSVSITPTFSTSKVLVTCYLQVGDSAADDIPFLVVRDSTNIGVGSGGTSNVSFYVRGDSESTASLAIWSTSWQYLDSPATTSATTYKVQWRVRTAGQTAYLNRFGAGTSFVTASTITVQEVPQ